MRSGILEAVNHTAQSLDSPAKRDYRLLSVGDILVDEFLGLPESQLGGECRLDSQQEVICFPYGQKIGVEKIEYSVGGNAANNAVGMSRLEVKTALWGTIGDDWTEKLILDAMAHEGVGTFYIEVAKGSRGGRGVVVNYQGERTILSFHPKLPYKIPGQVPGVEWIYLTSMGEGYEETYGALAQQKKVKMAFNPGTLQLREGVEKWKDVLAGTEVLFVNKEEAAKIVGSSSGDDVKEPLRQLAEMGPKVVVITDGKNGAYANDRGRLLKCSVYEVPVVERTGAGDAFGTGFLAATMEGRPAEEALRWGMVESASVLTKVGAQAGLLTRRELDDWLVRANNLEVKEI